MIRFCDTVWYIPKSFFAFLRRQIFVATGFVSSNESLVIIFWVVIVVIKMLLIA